MAYPAQPSPFIRSGWVANQLLPNPEYHASALTYLGGGWNPQSALGGGFAGGTVPASNPQVSGMPAVNASTLSQAPNSLAPMGVVGKLQASTNFPEWMNSLLQQMGMSGMIGSTIPAANTPAAIPTGQPALTQVANKNTSPAYLTPQFGQNSSNISRKKRGGLFGFLMDPLGSTLLGDKAPTQIMGKLETKINPLAKAIDRAG